MGLGRCIPSRETHTLECAGLLLLLSACFEREIFVQCGILKMYAKSLIVLKGTQGKHLWDR